MGSEGELQFSVLKMLLDIVQSFLKVEKIGRQFFYWFLWFLGLTK
jgi:hypothetical protein